MIKQLFKVKKLGAFVLSVAFVLGLSGYASLNAQHSLTTDAVQANPSMDPSDLAAFQTEISNIIDAVKNNNSYTDVQVAARVYFYKTVYKHVSAGVDLPSSIRGAINSTRVYLQEIDEEGSVDLKLLRQEGENQLL